MNTWNRRTCTAALLLSACSFLTITPLSVSMASSYEHSGHDTKSHEENEDREKEITLIHIGDIHGHMGSHTNVRSDSNGLPEGGLARIYTKVKQLRKESENSLTVMTGDTIHGSVEALFTRGQAMVDVINKFKIDVFAPGNWEFVYGTERFHELFTGPNPVAKWNTIASNVYYSGAPYADRVDERVLPPYWITTVEGIKFGFIGFTTERGPKVIGSNVVKGFRFTKGDTEIAELVALLRPQVDVLVMISELGIANNVRLTEAVPGIDIVFSSDMHEETPEPVYNANGVPVVAEGMDGSNIGEMKLKFMDKVLTEIEWEQHPIDSHIKENKKIARMVSSFQKKFRSGPDFIPHVNPINGTILDTPVDTIIGTAQVDLHRSNFSHENMPAVIEGSSHDFIADVFREMSGADLGVIRGFRYGTTIAAGDITLDDIYHFIPIGPYVGVGEVKGAVIKKVIENPADGSLNPDVSKWGGGWLFGWSGLRFNLDPYQTKGNRATNIEVYNRTTAAWEPLDMEKTYTLAGYNYDEEPSLINKVAAQNVYQVTDIDGNPYTAVNLIAEYLKTNTANPEPNRITLIKPLPDFRNILGFPLMQSIYGARADLMP